MSSWRFESETSALFESKISLERLQTKNVIELSVLRWNAVFKNLHERTALRRRIKKRDRFYDLAFV